jgi:UDP-N-acetyl-2-amino-2-deoxyglucuronate dehydrogenase
VPTDPLRFAVIGAGATIAPQHFDALATTEGATLVAVNDPNPSARARLAERSDAPFFEDVSTLLHQAEPDVVVILAPHPFHAPLAEAAFGAGAHVLVEKPMAVTVSEADRVIAAAERAGKTLAVVFQHRFSPMTERLRAWVASGELGAVVRVAMSEPWLRTSAYFRASPWRATWRGEGGGVLLNQGPHALDLLTHLLGLPLRVTGITRTARHAIECEDTALALLEWESGAIGTFTTSTTEPETGRRLELVTDRARIVVEGNRLRRTDFRPGLAEHAVTDPEPFGRPALTDGDEETLDPGASHAPVYADLVDAVRYGRPPRCHGEQGRMSLELANAIALSSWTQAPVPLPLDRAVYDAALAERRGR